MSYRITKYFEYKVFEVGELAKAIKKFFLKNDVEVKDNLIELPSKRRKRYINDLNLPKFDAKVLTDKKEISDIIETGLAENMETEQLDYGKKCNKKRIYHISIRNLENNKDITEIISDTGNRELTDDILTEILGELQDPRLFDINKHYDS